MIYNKDNHTTVLSQMKLDADGNPYLIATDWTANKEEVVSHVVGQSACGDMVIAFEDLNSTYSKSSDQDFNDLIFVVGDNLATRETTKLEAYNTDSEPFELQDMGEYCLRCIDANEDLIALTNVLDKTSKMTEDVYGKLFRKQDVYNQEIPLLESTKLYARVAYVNCERFNAIGWYKADKNVAQVEKEITDNNGYVKDEYILFKNLNGSDISSYSDFKQLASTAFIADQKIGFFIIAADSEIQGKVKLNSTGTVKDGIHPVRYTNIQGSDDVDQIELILQSACNNVLVAFEDIRKDDGDYNEVIIILLAE